MKSAVRQLSVVAGATGAILLLPLAAMQFTDQVVWTLADFVVAGVLLGGTGALYVLFSRLASSPQHRLFIGITLALALLVVWAELAVGIIGTPFAGS